MRRLNAKLIFGLLGTFVVLGILVFGIHWLQQGSIARALLTRAERAEKDDRPDQVVRYVSRYLELCPEDVEQRARLGTLLAGDRMPATVKVRTRAAMVLEQALLRDPTRNDLRPTLARVYLQIDRLDLAEEQLKTAQAAAKDNGEVDWLYGQFHEAKKNWPDAAAWYRKAILHAPREVNGYVFLADLLRRRFEKDKERAAEGDAVIDSLVEKNADNPKAHLARWQYRKQWVGTEDAVQTAASNVERALKLAPESADVLLAASELAQLRKMPDAARQYLETGCKQHPRDMRMHRELAVLELRQDRRERAIEVLRTGAKALNGPAKVELLWTLANVLIDGNSMREAHTVLAQMVKSNASVASMDYLNARVQMRQGNWAEAARLLERTRGMVTATPELATQVDLLLSECFNQLDDSAAQISALGRVVSRENGSAQTRAALAAALAGNGRLDDALEQYRQLMALPEAPKTGWIEIARLRVARDLQRLSKGRSSPAARRSTADDKDTDAALNKAAAENPDAVDVPLLRAELLMARGKSDDARALLKETIGKHKDRAEPWMALAALAALPEGGNDPAEGARILAEALKQLGDSVETRLAQVRYWVQRGGAEAGPALDRLRHGMEKFAAEQDQVRLLGELAEAQFRIGNAKEAGRLWNQLVQLPTNRNNLRLHLLLFDLALQAGDETALQMTLADLKRIEGEQGTLWRFAAASRLIYRGRRGKPEELEEARQLLDTVAARRPGWPNVLVARADLEEARNNLDQAITNYRQAMALGDRSPRTVRLLVQLLYRQQRYEEADQEMRQLQKEVPGGADLQLMQRLAVDISLQNQDPQRAVRLALKAVAADSTDYRDHLWQGQVLAASGLQPKQAEAELRRAVELDPKVPETWVALVQFLARGGQTKEAEAELAKALPQLPAEKAPLALAPCYEALGKADQAEEQYRKALAAKPEDVLLLRSLAAFYLRTGRLALAEPPLRQVIDRKVKASADEVNAARNTLAMALATCGDYGRLPEALALIGLSLDANGRVQETAPTRDALSPEQQRTRAQVLAAQSGREPRQKAIAMLEALARRQSLTGDDQFLLAQLYETTGAWQKAQPLYRSVAGPGSKNPTFLAQYAQQLLLRREFKEAEQCIARLEHLEKARQLQAGDFASIELRAALLEARGQGKEAIALLEKQVGSPEKPARLALLINCLTRQKRYAEALTRCEQARETCPAEMVAGATLAVLRASHADDESCVAIESWLQAACEKAPKSSALWFLRAGLADLRGRYDDAEKFCRKVLELDERNLGALNNLAWLLAQKPGKAAEGLTLINRAIALAGPRAELLDTRATAQMTLGHPDLAIADLESANSEAPDPARYFRLAQAHQLAKNGKQASTLLKKATASGLRPEQLHPVEQAALRKLMDELK